MKEQRDPLQEPSTDEENTIKVRPARRFGNYELLRRIDVGGMGEVYLARQRTAFGREVAIKIMRSDLVHDPVARKRFLREAEVTAHLLHEHILTLIEFSEEQGRLYLVTPYIKGGTLARRLQQGPLALGEVYQLFTALVQAIAYIHKRGVIHRDLKPGNILLDSEEEHDQVYVRLIDFGIASTSGEQASPPLTASGRELGTAAYMAPERLNGIAAPSNDIYSLGVILYEMLTGLLPSMSGRIKALPQPLSAIVRCCMAVNPEERFASADELLKAFKQAYEALSATPPLQQAAVTSTPPLPPLEKKTTSARMAAVKPEQPAGLNEVRVHRGEFVLAPLPDKGSAFKREDYDAPTSYVSPADLPQAAVHQQTAENDIIEPPPDKGKKRRKRSLIGILTTSIIAILFIMGGMSYLIFQASITATIIVTPRTQAVSKVLTVSAKPNQHSIDPYSSSLPAYVLTSNKTGSLDGPTTGQTNCSVLGIFDCQQAVSFADVNNLALQLRPTTRLAIKQDLQNQAHSGQCTTVGNIYYADGQLAANPPIGTASKTVTVTLSQQGSIECVKAQDVHTLALQLFQQQLPQNYTLMDQLTQVGSPVVQSVSQDGVVKITVPIGSVVRYQMPNDEIAQIQNHVHGMKPVAARAYIATLPGLDPNATSVKLSFGDTIPANTQQIHVTIANPTNYPPVQMPKVQ